MTASPSSGRALVAPHVALAIVTLCAVLLLVALHAGVLGYPFIEDDYQFLLNAHRGLLGSLSHAFTSVVGYFRPLGRELYFWTGLRLAGERSLAFHLVDLGILASTLALIARIGERLGGLRAGLLAAGCFALLYPNRVLLGYVSCAQDLIANALACAAVLAYLGGRSWLAAAAFLLAMLGKESVAPLPLVLAAWEAWPAGPRGSPRAREALRRTLPLWVALVLWAVFAVWLRATFADPDVRDTVVPGRGGHLTLELMLRGARLTALAWLGVEQPWSMLRDALPRVLGVQSAVAIGLAVLTAALALALTRGGPRPASEPHRVAPTPARLPVLGACWMVFGAVPPMFLGQRFNAYYAMFPGIGFALLVGAALSRRPFAALPVFAALAATSLVANATTQFRWDIADEQQPVGASVTTAARLDFERRFVTAFHAALREHPPRPGHDVYVDQPFGFRLMGTAGSRAAQLWLDDPTMQVRFLGRDRPPNDGDASTLLRFNAGDWTFTRIPEALALASRDGTDSLAAGRFAGARAALERASALAAVPSFDEERESILSNLGIAQLALGDTAAAGASWREAIATFERTPEGRSGLAEGGSARASGGRTAPHYTENGLASRAQGIRGALFGMAELDRRQRRLDGTRDWLRRVLALFPDDAMALDYTSRVERALGNDGAAEAAWRRLAALHPGYADSVLRSSGGR